MPLQGPDPADVGWASTDTFILQHPVTLSWQSQPWISVSFPSSKFLPSLQKPVRLGDSNRKTSVQCLHLVSPSRCRTQQRCINSGCLEQGAVGVGGANTGPGCFLCFSLVEEDPSLRVKIIPLLPTAGNICFFLGWRSSLVGHHEACQWRKLVIWCRRKHQYP